MGKLIRRKFFYRLLSIRYGGNECQLRKLSQIRKRENGDFATNPAMPSPSFDFYTLKFFAGLIKKKALESLSSIIYFNSNTQRTDLLSRPPRKLLRLHLTFVLVATKLGLLLKHSCVLHAKAMTEDLSNIFESHALDFWITEIHSTVVMLA